MRRNGRNDQDLVAYLTDRVERLEAQAAEGRGWLDRQHHRRLIVHTVDGHSFEGVLQVEAEDGVVLTAARHLAGDRPVELGGELWVPRERVSFVQTVR